MAKKKLLIAIVCGVIAVIVVAASFSNSKPKLERGSTGHTHVYSEKATAQATCSATGEKTFTWKCGDSYTEAIDKLGHDFKNGVCINQLQ